MPHLDHAGNPVGNSERLVFRPRFWDPEAVVAPPPIGDPRHVMLRLGEGAWISETDTPQGDVRWESRITLRQYTYSDISAGVIDVTNTDQLAVQGHPMLFDRPLPSDADPSQVHFKEQHVFLGNRTTGIRVFDMKALRTY